MSRIASEFWVKAYLKTLSLRGISAFVTSRGDDHAGAILIKLSPLNATATLFHRSFDLDSGDQVWAVLEQGKEADIDALIHRQRQFDPDLWVVEVENPENEAYLFA